MKRINGIFLRIICILAILLSLTIEPLSIAFAKPAEMPIVVQFNDGSPEKIEGTMRNIKHLMEAAKKQDTTPRVSVILFGTALPAFQKSKADPNTVQALKDLLTREKDVTWIACQNTLDRNGLKVTDLLDGFSTVPSGIFEVARLEKQGFVYLRP